MSETMVRGKSSQSEAMEVLEARIECACELHAMMFGQAKLVSVATDLFRGIADLRDRIKQMRGEYAAWCHTARMLASEQRAPMNTILEETFNHLAEQLTDSMVALQGELSGEKILKEEPPEEVPL